MRFFAAFAGLILLVLSACAEIALVEVAPVVISDKTFSDHIVSLASGKNCSVIRYNRGQTYCEEDEPNPAPRVYCYRTLGDITCYDQPDPYQGRQRRVDLNEHNYISKPYNQ